MKPEARVVIGSNLGEQQREIPAVCSFALEDPLDELARRAAATLARAREYCTESGNANRATVQSRVECVALGAHDHLVAVDESKPNQMRPTPGRLCLGGVIAVV